MQRILECLAEWGGVEKKVEAHNKFGRLWQKWENSWKKNLMERKAMLDLWILGLKQRILELNW